METVRRTLDKRKEKRSKRVCVNCGDPMPKFSHKYCKKPECLRVRDMAARKAHVAREKAKKVPKPLSVNATREQLIAMTEELGLNVDWGAELFTV